MTEITADIAGMRTKSHQTFVNQGVGQWEKHTKGIGAKLLLQMGFQPGKGLGKDLQGIATPVEAHLRKGRGAIGAYGPEKAASIAKVKKVYRINLVLVRKLEQNLLQDIISDEDEGPEDVKWKKKNISNKNKTRYYYRSVDDVIEKGKRPGMFKNLGNTRFII